MSVRKWCESIEKEYFWGGGFLGKISEEDVSEEDVSEGNVSEGDVSEGDISEGDISEGDFWELLFDFEKKRGCN